MVTRDTKLLLRSVVVGTLALSAGCASAPLAGRSERGADRRVQTEQAPPHYPPTAMEPGVLPITENAYGAFRKAPNAPKIGESVADFVLTGSAGQQVKLADLRAKGPVGLIFFRGFW